MQAVRVRDLSFAYEGRRNILEEISFDISAGETFVIAGLSGSGKTTLCHIMSGIIPNVIGGRLGGTVILMEESVSGAPLHETACRCGLVFQDPDNQIVCTTVEDELAFGLENLCVEPAEIRRRVDLALERFGLGCYALSNPAQLSGGFKKILSIAAVVIMEPPVVILDEPMTGLDTENRALVREAVEGLCHAGRTVIIVEHDLSLVDYADKWMLIENGRIAALDAPAVIMSNPERLREMGLLV